MPFLLVLFGLFLAACSTDQTKPLSSQPGASSTQPVKMVEAPVITVYKSPTCGCCGKWVEHLKQNGFRVQSVDTSNVQAVKAELGVPDQLGSCHTAKVDGYVVEGHVPADLIHRMLKERPEVSGLAVPGMPMGSPGMEGSYSEKYDILAFKSDGSTTVFASR